LFPIKLGLRVLLNSLVQDEPWMSLNAFLETASNQARVVGDRLQKLDESARRQRDEAYAAGLPSLKRGADNFGKSADRFKHQFLVYVRTDGKVDGALARLKFVAVRVVSGAP